jgi:hypothetical protein
LLFFFFYSVRCNTRIQKENTGGTLQTLAVALLLLLVLLLLLFSFPLRIYKGTQSTHTLKENTDVLMSQMYMALVNETVVEAVRVALDDYAMSHDTTPEVNALPGIITTAEEEVIHRAVLVGLQNLCRVQRIVSSTSSQQHTVGYDDRPLADDDATAAATRAEAAASLRKGFGLLMHNNTALQDVVHRVVTSIQAYLGESRQSGKRDGGAVAGVYSAAPEVTQMLGDAVEQQLLWNGGETPGLLPYLSSCLWRNVGYWRDAEPTSSYAHRVDWPAGQRQNCTFWAAGTTHSTAGNSHEYAGERRPPARREGARDL